MRWTYAAALVALGVISCCAAQAQKSAYEVVTSSRAMAASAALNNLDFKQIEERQKRDPKTGEYRVTPNVDMYTVEQMDYMVENNLLEAVVLRQDRCQFVPDIEDRARLVHLPAFEFAWGHMLVAGICVRKDEVLGVDYIKKAADNGYAPAMERVAFYYERGFHVTRDLRRSESYMHTAAALGSKTGRLGWADMLVRGFGSPQLYEEAFSWLYHADYSDPYSKDKQIFLQGELQKRMPTNVVARDMAFEYGI